MKFLILLFVSLSANASYINISSCLSGGGDLFTHKTNCENDTAGECLEFPGGSCRVLDVVVSDGVKSFSVNLEKVQALQALKDIEVNHKEIEAGKKAAAKERIKNVDWSKSMSAAQLKAALMDHMEEHK